MLSISWQTTIGGAGGLDPKLGTFYQTLGYAWRQTRRCLLADTPLFFPVLDKKGTTLTRPISGKPNTARANA